MHHRYAVLAAALACACAGAASALPMTQDAYKAQQMRIESGQTVIVGVNKFADDAEPLKIATPDFSALEREQVARLREVKAKRDNGAVQRTLATLAEAARGYAPASGDDAARLRAPRREPLMPLIIDAVRARASVGEIAGALAGIWGRYTPGR